MGQAAPPCHELELGSFKRHHVEPDVDKHAAD
jgi:hypothetical protein